MLQTQNGRPHTETATQQASQPWNHRTALVRRSGAALRLEPLDCGHRDPMACYWAMCGERYDDADYDLDGGWCPTRAMDWQEREAAGRCAA